MKKFVVMILCLMLVLCACGSKTPEATQPAATQPAATQPAATQPAQTEPATEPAQQPTEPTETEPQTSGLELAQSCIDCDVSELFALVGEPNDAEYIPSCLGEGEDGTLYYDDFTVYTYKEGDSEVVQFVE